MFIITRDTRPLAVVKAYWQEVYGLEEDATVLMPIRIEMYGGDV